MDTAAAKAELKRITSARKRLVGRGRERDERLSELVVQLGELQRPITALLKTGPRTGAALRHADERELSKAIQAEKKRIAAMLQRSPGGGRSRRAEPLTLAQYNGFLGYVEGAINAGRARLTEEEPGTCEFRDAALEVAETCRRLQRQLKGKNHKAAHWSAVRTRDGGWQTANGLPDRHERALLRGSDLKQPLAKLRRNAEREAKRKLRSFAAPAAPRRRWTKETAAAAAVEWMRRYGRVPRTADFRSDPTLPSYETMRKLSGGLPTEKMTAWLAKQAT